MRGEIKLKNKKILEKQKELLAMVEALINKKPNEFLIVSTLEKLKK